MTNTAITRRITAALAGPLVAAGVLIGTMAATEPAVAGAQPAADGQCASMTMTQPQGGANPGALTRAGQVAAATGSSASDGSMAVACEPASHG